MTHAAPYPPFALPQRTLRVGAAATAPSDAGAVGHIFNLGHVVLPKTDPELLTDLVGLVHSL